ncbi:MAG: sugar transferase [Butyrivibrio sp.]|nr:sugar transferase [Butyrivibrio sp.]
MNQRNKIIEVYGLWALDLISIVISFVLATYIRFGNFKDMGDQNIHFLTCLLLLLFCTIYSFFFDWNRNFLKRGPFTELAAVVQYNMIMVIVVLVLLYMLSWASVFSRLVMGYFAIFNMILSYLLHLLVKKFFCLYFSSDQTTIKVLVLTQKDQLQPTIERLRSQLDITYRIVGACCIDEDMSGTQTDGVSVIAGKDNLLEVTTPMALDEVFINTPDMTQRVLEDIITGYDEMGVNCHYCLEMPSMQSSSRVGTFGDYSVLTYTRFQSSYKKLVIKRLMDLAGGLIGLMITLILTPFIAIAIKADSRGPVFFSQVRIGRNGRRFKIYKFRSMYLDAEARKKELEKDNEMNGLMFKMTNDPRVTRVGAFLRKTSLDELPQFWNIFKGDMSLVGTRPPTEDEFNKYNQYYRRRISMTPGLTGMWQVSGRSDIEDFDEVVRLDLRYIDHWSLTLDIKILLQTIAVVFRKRGAH